MHLCFGNRITGGSYENYKHGKGRKARCMRMEHLQLNLRVERWWKYKSTRVYHRQHSRFTSESASVTYAGFVLLNIILLQNILECNKNPGEEFFSCNATIKQQ